jgi:hypothetical protein
MTPEEVARRFENIPGFDLVDCAEVALPLWQLGVEALSVAHRRFQPISEYVMRALNVGLRGVEIGGFLGLEADVVRGTLAQLVVEKFVKAEPGLEELTDVGRRTLAEGSIQVPVEEQLTVLFDGLIRKPLELPPEQIALPRDIEDGEVVEIAAIPPTRPTVADLKIAEVVNVLERQSGGRAEMGRDVLRLKRISRYRRYFRRGVGLVFKARKGKELRLMFVIEGMPNEELQHKFAEAGGTSRPGFVRAFSDAYLAANVRRHLGPEVSRLVLDFSEYEKLQRRVSIVKLRRVALERKLALAQLGELPQAEAPDGTAIDAVRKEEAEALVALAAAPVRPASVYEPFELLTAAFLTANSSISVSSKGLAPHIVDRRLVQLLRRGMARGVQVDLTLHEIAFDWARRGGAWNRAYSEVDTLVREFPDTFRVHRTKEDRFFHLSWDRKVAMVCNRPFLSNQGRVRSFEQFAGFVLQRPDLVDAYIQRITRPQP